MGVRIATSAADAVADTDIIVAAVTAASSFEAAQSVAPHIKGTPFYLDVNSVSPGRKQETARCSRERRALRRCRDRLADSSEETPNSAAARRRARESVLPMLVDELEMQGASRRTKSAPPPRSR